MPKTVRRIQARLADERGIALVLALAIVLALGTATASVALYSSSNVTDSARSRGDQVALALAEAGLNMAYSTLSHSSNPSMANALSPTPVPDVPLAGGTATYYGSLSGTEWTLTGLGRAPNPAVPGQTIVRVVHGRAHVGTASVGGANNAVWNYVYADSTSTCTTLGNSVNISVPLYVHGDLCMQNQARVTSYAVQVGGSVTMSSPQNEVGDPSAPLHDIHIGKGCSVDGITYTSPCGPGQRVYGTTVDSSPTTLAKPPVDLTGTAQSAALGPMHGCTVGGVPWGGFDKDSNPLNVSLGTINIAPKGQAYDCKALDANGNVVAELGWDGSERLTIAGTIYLDANIAFGQQNEIVYKGKATIYTSGTVTIGQQTSVCGVDDCGTDWNPNQNLLAWVAGAKCPANGAELDSMSIQNYSTFQGAIYTVCDYREGNNVTVWGPIVSHQLYLQNSTRNFYVPIGTLLPGMPSTYDQVVTITPEPGSWS